MKLRKFKKGDLVYYNHYVDEAFIKPDKQMGVIIGVNKDANPLFINFPEKEHFADEYIVIWIETGFRSTLLGLNLIKVEAPCDTLSKNQ